MYDDFMCCWFAAIRLYRDRRFSGFHKNFYSGDNGSQLIAAVSATWFVRIGYMVTPNDGIWIHKPKTGADGSHEGIKTGNSGRDKASFQLYLGHENCWQAVKGRVGRPKANGEVIEAEHSDRDESALSAPYKQMEDIELRVEAYDRRQPKTIITIVFFCLGIWRG